MDNISGGREENFYPSRVIVILARSIRWWRQKCMAWERQAEELLMQHTVQDLGTASCTTIVDIPLHLRLRRKPLHHRGLSRYSSPPCLRGRRDRPLRPTSTRHQVALTRRLHRGDIRCYTLQIHHLLSILPCLSHRLHPQVLQSPADACAPPASEPLHYLFVICLSSSSY